MTKSARCLLLFTGFAMLAMVSVITLLEQYKFPSDALSISSMIDVETGQTVTLPLRRMNLTGQPQQYRFRTQLEQSDFSMYRNNESLYVYLPRFEQNIAVSVNGKRISESHNTAAWRGPLVFNYAFIHIPTALLSQPIFKVDVQISTSALPPVSLYPIYIGSYEQLGPIFAMQKFLEYDVRLISTVLLCIVCVMALIVFVKLPQQRAYLWLTLACGLFLPIRITNILPLPENWLIYIPWLYFLMPFAALSILHYVRYLSESSRFNIPLLAVALTTFIGVLCATLELLTLRQSIVLFVFPWILVTLFCAVILLIQYAYQTASWVFVLLLTCLLGVCIGVAHDVLVLNNILDHAFMVSFLSVFCLVVALLLQLYYKLVSLLNIINHANEHLVEQLAQKEIALQQSYQERQAFIVQQCLNTERDRITAELHDGVAGHLTSILTIANAPEPKAHSYQSIASLTKYAINDVRLLVDTFSSVGSDPNVLFAIIKERCFSPLASANIRLHWGVTSIPEHLFIDPALALDLIRIMQEILNNAIKHGAPTQLSCISEVEQQTLKITVTNSGGSELEQTRCPTPGHGLLNIRKRIAKFPDGVFELTPIATGACAVFVFTLEDRQAGPTRPQYPSHSVT